MDRGSDDLFDLQFLQHITDSGDIRDGVGGPDFVEMDIADLHTMNMAFRFRNDLIDVHDVVFDFFTCADMILNDMRDPVHSVVAVMVAVMMVVVFFLVMVMVVFMHLFGFFLAIGIDMHLGPADTAFIYGLRLITDMRDLQVVQLAQKRFPVVKQLKQSGTQHVAGYAHIAGYIQCFHKLTSLANILSYCASEYERKTLSQPAAKKPVGNRLLCV